MDHHQQHKLHKRRKSDHNHHMLGAISEASDTNSVENFRKSTSSSPLSQYSVEMFASSADHAASVKHLNNGKTVKSEYPGYLGGPEEDEDEEDDEEEHDNDADYDDMDEEFNGSAEQNANNNNNNNNDEELPAHIHDELLKYQNPKDALQHSRKTMSDVLKLLTSKMRGSSLRDKRLNRPDDVEIKR